MSRDALDRVVAFWEDLTPAALEGLECVYADDAHFRDPFNDVRGAADLKRVLRHMFETLHTPTFVVREAFLDGDCAFLVWDFDFRIKSLAPARTRRIHGVSHVRFAADGRVAFHRDYWDAAGELYAQLPLIGPLVRWLARNIGVRLPGSNTGV